MKKNYFLAFAAFVVFAATGHQVSAQETEIQTSTAENPVWYNINSAATAYGSINAAMAPKTDATWGEIIKGEKPVSPDVTLPAQNQDKFLWRFHNDGSGNVIFVNKLTGTQITNPPTATLGLAERFRMSATGSAFTHTAVAGISGNGVSGTAFYFTPLDAAYAAVGRLNSDGGVAELVLFKAGTNGDILQTGGKGSLFWMRKVLMKTVSVSVSTAGGGTGTVKIMKDDGITPEAETTVSKAQTIGVTVVAEPGANSNFLAWMNAATQDVLSTDATYSYVDTYDIELEAVFDVNTAIEIPTVNADVYPVPFNKVLNVSNALLSHPVILTDLSGKIVMSSVTNTLNTANLAPGMYILKYLSPQGTEKLKVTKK